MKKWAWGFILFIVAIIVTLIVDAADPSRNVLTNTENITYEQMSQEQIEALEIQKIYTIIYVIFIAGAHISIGGMIFEIWNKSRQNG
jgi:N6-adenosine-specific RNA methylase IME4